MTIRDLIWFFAGAILGTPLWLYLVAVIGRALMIRIGNELRGKDR